MAPARGRHRRHGFFSPQMMPTDQLAAGRSATDHGLKDVTQLRVGDTLTHACVRAAGHGRQPRRCPATGRQADGLLRCSRSTPMLPDCGRAREAHAQRRRALMEPETRTRSGSVSAAVPGLLHMTSSASAGARVRPGTDGNDASFSSTDADQREELVVHNLRHADPGTSPRSASLHQAS